jgi:ketosteroid isomerase-like protein
VRAAVEHGLDVLFAEREADPQRSLTARLTEPRLPDQAITDPDAHFVSRAFDAWNTTGAEGAAAWMSRWVELTDPPERADGATWRGREAVLARLQEVSAELGAARVEVMEAHSDGDEVLVSFAPRDQAGHQTDPPAFHMRVDIEGGEIVRLRAFFGPAAPPRPNAATR